MEEMLEKSEPMLTAVMKNEQRELAKFVVNKNNHEKMILSKMKENTPKGLRDLGSKDGQFQKSLSENITRFSERLSEVKNERC